MEKKTHIKSLCNPKYIGSYELQVNENESKEIVVVLGKVSQEMIVGSDGKEKEGIVIQIVGQKPMILNATNRKRIIKMYGYFVEDWVGKRVTLCIENGKHFGEFMDTLRIKQQKPAPPELTPENVLWGKIRIALETGKKTIVDIKANFTLSAENEKLLLTPIQSLTDVPTR